MGKAKVCAKPLITGRRVWQVFSNNRRWGLRVSDGLLSKRTDLQRIRQRQVGQRRAGTGSLLQVELDCGKSL
jgi:hypothetical protein